MIKKRNIPKVSVIMPVYNAERYLREAVESILNQTYRDFELLLFDDGSTDNSKDIINLLATRDDRIVVFSRGNKGLVATLNEMIKSSKGEFIARMDADDISLPKRLELQTSFLEKNIDIVAVGGLSILINERTQKITPLQQPLDHNAIDSANLIGHCSIVHPSAMIRKDALLAVGSYRIEFPQAQDLDLWLRMAEVGRLANLPDPILLFRIHSESISERHGDAQKNLARLACSEACNRRGITREFESAEHWRPSTELSSQLKFLIQYGWSAWQNNYRDAWAHYAWRAIKLSPFELKPWKLLIFGYFKRPVSRGHEQI